MVRRSRFTTLLAASLLTGVAPFVCASDEGPPIRMTDDWSQTVVLEGRLGPIGECRLWVEEGWLMVERRSAEDEVEWKVVLAKVRGHELPKVVTNGGTLRLSYGDKRFFIRDEACNFRCLREAKPANVPWPRLDISAGSMGSAVGLGTSVSGGVTKSWFTAVLGPTGGAADAIVRLEHEQLPADDPLPRFSIETGVSTGVARAGFGEMHLVDDGELLVAERRSAREAEKEFADRAKRLIGLPAPDLPAGKSFNSEAPVTWEGFRGRPVLLVFLDLRRASSREQIPAIEGFYKFHREKGLRLIAVQRASAESLVEKLVTQFHLDIPIIIDDAQTSQRYEAVFPSYFLIHRDRKVALSKRSLPSATEMIEFTRADEERTTDR